ncbi:unnamed protein product [Arctia plantaginis]|uniref:Mediator of RNA polymerase II transcription subunit 25 n=1 Tax=Arctia plantaginis TaxID=874455 RepID=A0A8S1AW58_ARCPL|nr:unnamed protein product [Arctia plantaginis]
MTPQTSQFGESTLCIIYPKLLSENEIAHGVPLAKGCSVLDDHIYCQRPDDDDSVGGLITIKGDIFQEHQYSLPSTSNSVFTSHLENQGDISGDITFEVAECEQEESKTNALGSAVQPVSDKDKIYKSKQKSTSRKSRVPLNSKTRRYIRQCTKIASNTQCAQKQEENLALLSNFEKLDKKAKAFLFMQLKLATSNKMARRFTLEDKLFGLALMKQSPKGYKLLEKMFALPNKRTLAPTGLKPLALICDQGSTFRSCFKMLTDATARLYSSQGRENDGRIRIAGQDLFLLHDPPHLLKMTRKSGIISLCEAAVIFVIEATAANGAYIGELKTNYIIPTLEYFHGGALDEGGGSGSMYGLVTYKSADCHPGVPVSTYGPFTCPQTVVEAVDKIQYVGGHAESRACVTEALTAALACFDDIGRTDIPIHVLLLCSSPPYSAYAGGLVPPGAPATVEQAARLLAERGVQVSVAAARRVPALHALYEHAGGELHQAQQRNYAKDPRHLVLLRGYSLKERPPSPAPPPVPDIQTDVYGQGRGAGVPARPGNTTFPRPGVAAATVGPVAGVGGVGNVGVGVGVNAACGRGANWLPPPRAPLYANNSALLTQLAQPSYPPPPPAHATQAGHPRMQGMVAGTSAGLQRSYIWSGVIEWMEKGKTPGDQQKTTKHLPCQVSASTKDIEPELKVDTWPSKLLMQLMPKQLISNIGGQYLKDSKSVLFHLQPSEALDALTKVMVNGFAGCVHFSPMPSPPQCDIKVLILLYTPDKKAYLGFIPNNQATFVDRLRKVIQQQKISQIISKQQLPPAGSAAGGMAPNMPPNTMAGNGAMPTAGMSSGGMGSGMSGGMQPVAVGNVANVGGVGNVGQMAGPGPSQGMVQTQMQQHPQGMMIGGSMGGQVQQVGGKGPRPVTQLDGLEAARQQNLEKIQHLQQTLEAAHQQEAQFKSQMDIMSHLHAAQQQEQHYKQLEEQRKHQLQQQLQQQLRATSTAHQPRIMHPRNILPSNPGLRHLLQQQQQQPRGPRPHM